MSRPWRGPWWGTKRNETRMRTTMKIGRRHNTQLALSFASFGPPISVSLGFIGTSSRSLTGGQQLLFEIYKRQMTIQQQQTHQTQDVSTSLKSSSNSHEDTTTKIIRVLEEIQKQNKTKIDWDDRMSLQSQWSLTEKGWNVQVEWKDTAEYGVGLFAAEDIPADTIMRQGIIVYNLFQFQSAEKIEDFCQSGSGDDDEEYEARLRYVSDYLWGFDPNTATDTKGYPSKSTKDDNNDWFFGFWIPGNSLNHKNNDPTMVYRATWTTENEDNDSKNSVMAGINVVALRDIKKGEQIFDDYQRHGTAPQWLHDFVKSKNNNNKNNNIMTLNFADCNDFVNVAVPDEKEKKEE